MYAFTLTGADTYSVTISAVGTDGPTNLPVVISGTLTGTVGTAIDRVRLFDFNQGTSTPAKPDMPPAAFRVVAPVATCM